ncbi:elicitor-responsive protein 1-like [Nymphaea colorata]|uniref:elicitor-responsive protein 1-like n=1 Tax=Nymphaea colorata TaxID=210225 RepID=UPI00214E7200|nr:elicitor-responsive protein 1-like [Nymphaea colorata]
MELHGGVLEVLLVDAEGLKKPHFLGTCDLYVVIQYGDQAWKSKVVQLKSKAARWNEKFKIKITGLDEGHAHKLALRIMDADNFAKTCVGETLIHLGGIITEGNEKGSMEVKAAPYNVVLKDLSYHGVIRVGLKFTANVDNFHELDPPCSLTLLPFLLMALLVNDFSFLRDRQVGILTPMTFKPWTPQTRLCTFASYHIKKLIVHKLRFQS